jgi:hypothetical protein
MVGPHPWLGVAFVSLLGIAFLGMASTLLPMLHAGESHGSPRREQALSTVTPLGLALLALALGVSIPPALTDVLRRAAAALGG